MMNYGNMFSRLQQFAPQMQNRFAQRPGMQNFMQNHPNLQGMTQNPMMGNPMMGNQMGGFLGGMFHRPDNTATTNGPAVNPNLPQQPNPLPQQQPNTSPFGWMMR